MPDRFDQALEYARRGWPIFPVHTALAGQCSCGHPACDRVAKHPRTAHGLKDATASTSAIVAWWTTWPDANIGFPTGKHFTVLDVDPQTGGDEVLRALEATHGLLPPTWRCQTGGGGTHLYFAPVPGLRNSASLLGPGLDIRGEGGYLIGPGSTHASGRDYLWEIGFGPEEVPLAPMPAWMVERLRHPRVRAREDDAQDRWAELLAGAEQGKRNDTATRIAGHYARLGLPAGEIAQILLGQGALCTPPINRDEAEKFRDIARRIWEKEQAKQTGSMPTAPEIRDGWAYRLDEGRLVYERNDARGQERRTVRLADFDAWIRADETLDVGDGQPTHRYQIEGVAAPGADHPGSLPPTEVPAEDFERLGWVHQAWGARALITATPGQARHHLALAIQTRTKADLRTVYGHTGWRRFGEQWAYLHGQGAIGAPDVQVRLDPIFWRFGLPSAPDPARVASGLQHLFETVRAVAPRVMLPLVASLFLAPLNPWHDTPFTFLLLGHTGLGKSSLLSLVFNGYGTFPTERDLPLGWSSTANYLEDCLFTFKDHVIVIDDVGQTGAMYDTQAKYERVLRAQANRVDRGRMRADGSLRPRHPPRGLLFVSAQTPPLDEALLARTFAIELRAGEVDLSTPRGTGKPLDRAQEPSRLEAMRHALAAYIQWLTPPEATATALSHRIRDILTEARRHVRAAVTGHARLPETLATVLLGWRFGLDFAVARGQYTPEQAKGEWAGAVAHLTDTSRTQRADLQDRRPARQYFARLQTLVDSGRVGFLPQRASAPLPRVPGERDAPRPPPMVGWFSETSVYIDPHAAAELFRQARDQNEPLAVTEAQVMAELRDAHVLIPDAEGRLKRPEMVGGRTRRVYSLARPALETFLGVAFDPEATAVPEDAPAPGVSDYDDRPPF